MKMKVTVSPRIELGAGRAGSWESWEVGCRLRQGETSKVSWKDLGIFKHSLTLLV